MGKVVSMVLVLLAALPEIGVAQVRLIGQVRDETKVALRGVALSLRPQEPAPDRPILETLSGQTGDFSFEVPSVGSYLLGAKREGYFLLEDLPVELSEGDNELTVVLHHLREVHESVDVAYSPPAIDFEQTSSEQAVTGNDILFVPYPSSHSLNNAMRILPGAVVQDAQGEIHFNGGATNQTYWTLDGFNITDPLTGRFDTQLNVEAARSVTISSGRYAAEFGKGSAGALVIETGMGDDRFRYATSNFVPGIEHRKGLTIGDWRPRLNVSGPIAKGRAWFFNSSDLRYTNHIVQELPEGQDRTPRYQLSNLFRNQINLTPSNILYSGFLVTALNAPRSGLGLLDPPETTADRRARQYFFHLKDQLYFRQGMVLELGYARNHTYGREIPQGQGLYILTPRGRQGNYFVDAKRWARRDQWLASAILPSFSFAGNHQVKAGLDLNWLEYRQDVRRTGFERRRLDGTLRRRVVFGGDGRFQRSNTEAAWFLQDGWKVKPNLLLEIGVRQDWDRMLADWSVSPRFAFNWSPRGWHNTKLTGGYAIVHDATNLQTFTRHLDQYSVSTSFDLEGRVEQGPVATLFALDQTGLRSPRYANWSLGVEQRLPGEFYARVNYLRKRGRDGLSFEDVRTGITPKLAQRLAELEAEFRTTFGLRNHRRDMFDSVELTVRKTFRKQYVWLGSYTRSRAVSNAALDISIDNPVLMSENFGPMPWDSPNRLLSWGYFPLSKKYALAYMLEWRSGFPFSVEDDEGRIVGPVNSRRLPDFLELNVHLERKIALLGQRWALRGGFLNLLDRKNPTLVNNNINASNFLEYFGGTPRAFVTRIRWLGKKQEL